MTPTKQAAIDAWNKFKNSIIEGGDNEACSVIETYVINAPESIAGYKFEVSDDLFEKLRLGAVGHGCPSKWSKPVTRYIIEQIAREGALQYYSLEDAATGDPAVDHAYALSADMSGVTSSATSIVKENLTVQGNVAAVHRRVVESGYNGLRPVSLCALEYETLIRAASTAQERIENQKAYYEKVFLDGANRIKEERDKAKVAQESFENLSASLAQDHRLIKDMNEELTRLKSQLAATDEMEHALTIAKRDIKNWVTSEDAIEASILVIDIAIAKYRAAKEGK